MVDIGYSGKEKRIWNRQGGSADNIYKDFDLMTLGFAESDFTTSHNWYLKVYDAAGGDQGRIDYFKIEICSRIDVCEIEFDPYIVASNGNKDAAKSLFDTIETIKPDLAHLRMANYKTEWCIPFIGWCLKTTTITDLENNVKKNKNIVLVGGPLANPITKEVNEQLKNGVYYEAYMKDNTEKTERITDLFYFAKGGKYIARWHVYTGPQMCSRMGCVTSRYQAEPVGNKNVGMVQKLPMNNDFKSVSRYRFVAITAGMTKKDTKDSVNTYISLLKNKHIQESVLYSGGGDIAFVLKDYGDDYETCKRKCLDSWGYDYSTLRYSDAIYWQRTYCEESCSDGVSLGDFGKIMIAKAFQI